MSLQVKNSKDLLDPETYKAKLLVVGLAGSGKTSFASTAPNPGFAACETGHGRGLLSIAHKGLDYVELDSIVDLDSFCSGGVFKEKESLILDSLSDTCKNIVKDHALTFQRKGGDTKKRSSGVPELDDYGVMGELSRKYVRKLLGIDKHIICTALMKIKEPDENSPGSELLIGPDLPGQMFLGAVAMFDLVLVLKTRQALRDPRDPKSRYVERFFVTQTTGPILAKNRLTLGGGKQTPPLLDPEETFELETGKGSFGYLLEKIRSRLREFKEGKPNE